MNGSAFSCTPARLDPLASRLALDIIAAGRRATAQTPSGNVAVSGPSLEVMVSIRSTPNLSKRSKCQPSTYRPLKVVYSYMIRHHRSSAIKRIQDFISHHGYGLRGHLRILPVFFSSLTFLNFSPHPPFPARQPAPTDHGEISIEAHRQRLSRCFVSRHTGM